jgi:hemoglobin-like flavoprotein
MTPEQIRLIQESFARVVPIQEQAAGLFYGRLFETAPETRPLFAKADMAAQGRKLMAAIAHVVGHLCAPEAMLPAVRDLARRHVGYGVTEAHYGSVGAALLWTLEQGLGPAFTPEIRDAWAAAYGLLSGVMIEAAGEMATARAA